MTQFGWAHASSGVTRWSSARERLLNGPPDPVRRILRIPFATSSPEANGGRHWKMALCSLSIGSSMAPLARTVSMNTGPATTSASLFASSSFLPALAAASVARSPAAPTIAAMTQSTSGREATSTSPASPARTRQPTPASARRSRSRGACAASATHTVSGRCRLHRFASSSTCRWAVSAATRKRDGCRAITSRVLAPIEPVAPSIAMFWIVVIS